MSGEQQVLYERRGVAAWVTLNRPAKLNAIDAAVADGLAAALAAAEADDDVKLLVLRGAGRAFSAGFDLGAAAARRSPAEWRERLAGLVDLTMRLRDLSKPTLALVHGWCLAGAWELAMACDLVIAADDARFAMPEVKFGSGPTTQLMPFIVGHRKASELLLTGDVIDAAEAERLGFLNRVVAAHELEAAGERFARKLAPTPLPVLRLTKLGLLRAADAAGVREAVTANLDVAAILNATQTPEGEEFERRVAADGLKAALAWRESRYAEEDD